VPTAYENFERTIERANAVVALHEQLHGRRGRPAQNVSDLLRGALVLAVAALDGFVLEASVHAVPAAARQGLLGETANKWAKDSADQMVKALSEEDPAEAFAAVIRSHTEILTFQKAKMIEGHLQGLLGADPPWEIAALLLRPPHTAENVQTQLDEIVSRRNRIAHSGDLTANGSTRPITRDYVRNSLQILEAVGGAVDMTLTQRLG
jgi:hypothetical protein